MDKNIKLYYEILSHTTPSGLPVKYIKKKGMKTFYFYILVNYGSQELEYVDLKDNIKYTITPGVAHFLEHKIFESKDRSTFEAFSRQSASVNAYTGFSYTVYYFICTSHIKENIALMMRLITETYINRENVEREKGIITQEIKMYYDDPGWRTYNSFLNNLYRKNPIKYDVAGSIEDVESITPEELLRVYRDFYTSDNMMIFMLGDVDEGEIFKAVDEASGTSSGRKLKRLYPEEEKPVERAFSSSKMHIGKKLFAMGFKEIPFGCGPNGMRQELLLNIIMDYLVGKASKLYERLYGEKLIDSSFGHMVSCGLNFAYILVSGASGEPEKVRDIFLNELNAAKSKGMDSRELDLIKKMLLGESIRLSDNDEAFIKTIIAFQNKKQDWFQMTQVLDSIKIEEVNRALNHMLDEECFTMAVTVPK